MSHHRTARAAPVHLVFCGLMAFALGDGRARAASGAPAEGESNSRCIKSNGRTKCYRMRTAIALLLSEGREEEWAEFVLKRKPNDNERDCGRPCVEADASERARCSRLPNPKSAFVTNMSPEKENCFFVIHQRRIQCVQRCLRTVEAKLRQAIYRGHHRVGLLGAHGKWVVAEPDGRLRADRPELGPWEQFEIVHAAPKDKGKALRYGQTVLLRTHHGKFVVAGRAGSIRADGAAKDPGAKWRVESAAKDYGPVVPGAPVRLRSAYGKYLVAEPDGSAAANRAKAGPWETFVLRSK